MPTFKPLWASARLKGLACRGHTLVSTTGIYGSSLIVTRCVLHRSSYVLWLDRPSLWLPMDLHYWSDHIRYWRFDVLAIWSEALLWRFRRIHVHCRLRPFDFGDIRQPVHCYLRSTQIFRTPSQSLSIFPGNRIRGCSPPRSPSLLRQCRIQRFEHRAMDLSRSCGVCLLSGYSLLLRTHSGGD
jgi:hypothetical protein